MNIDKQLGGVELRIIALLSALDTQKGKLSTSKANLAIALKLRSVIIKEIMSIDASYLNRLAGRHIEKIKKRWLDEGLEISMSAVDRRIVNVMVNDSLALVQELATTTAIILNKKIYERVVTGQKITELYKDTKQLIRGEKDRRGVSMKIHTNTIIDTSIADIDGVITKRKGQEHNIKKWTYYGTDIATTRHFCRERVGKVFTSDEIEKWRNLQFSGKKDGDPFVTRGGWNCRHHFAPKIRD